LGASLGAIRTVWRTRPRPSGWRRGTRGCRPWRGGLTAARDSSGEQLREQQSGNDQIKGTGGLLTLRGSAGVTKQQQRRKDVTGRRQWGSGYARIAPVSADRMKHRGDGHTEGCPEQLIARRNSPFHGNSRWPQNGQQSTAGGDRALCTRGQSERKRVRGFGRGRK
jgi:hypothetical protein